MSDIPSLPSGDPRPQTGGYGGLTGYGKGNYGAPPPSGGMPYRPTRPTVKGEVEQASRPTVDQADSSPRPTGPAVLRRAVGAIIDTVVVFAPTVVVFGLLENFLYKGSCDQVRDFYGDLQLIDCSSWVLFAAWVLAIAIAAGLAFMVSVGPTAGGRLSLGGRLGLWGRVSKVRVVDRSTGLSIGVSRAAARFAFRTFVSTILGIGFLWMIWDKDDRTLHDIVCRTAVVRA